MNRFIARGAQEGRFQIHRAGCQEGWNSDRNQSDGPQVEFLLLQSLSPALEASRLIESGHTQLI